MDVLSTVIAAAGRRDGFEKGGLGLLLFPASARPTDRGCAMRLTMLAVFLSTGVCAFCQTAAPFPANPDQFTLNPPIVIQPERDFTKLPSNINAFGTTPRQLILVPTQRKIVVLPESGFNRQIDKQMIVHPPQSSLGEQAPGTLVAQNLYPGLQLLPIDELMLKAEPIPTIWPNLKMQRIPVAWPKLEIKQMESGTTAQAARR